MYVGKHNYNESVDLLYWNGHFALIKCFSRLFYDISKHKGTLFWCRRCLGHFKSEDVFERHKQLCTRENYYSIVHVLPDPDTTIKFK
jgi:hypothetical protein